MSGLITPVAVSTGDGSREALCTYLVVLDAGALGIARGLAMPLDQASSRPAPGTARSNSVPSTS